MLPDFVKLSLGEQHSMVLHNSSVWQAGSILQDENERFIQVIKSGAQAVAAGTDSSIVLMEDGSVYAVGSNTYGQLGDGTKTSRNTLTCVQVIPGAMAVALGAHHSMILTQEGYVWMAGWNKHGQLGLERINFRARFWQAINSEAKAVAAGD